MDFASQCARALFDAPSALLTKEILSYIILSIEAFDERLTTAYSERLLIEAGMSRRKRKKVLDSLSAEVILQGYLDAQREERR